MYHNPADYVIELACAEYGLDKIDMMKKATMNGTSLTYYEDPGALPSLDVLRGRFVSFFLVFPYTSHLEMNIYGADKFKHIKIMFKDI